MANIQLSSKKDLSALVLRGKGRIEALMPQKGLLDRFVKMTEYAADRNPAILKCTPKSILMSVYTLAYLGLEPGGPLGLADLVPYKGVCTPIIGYKGFVDLAWRTGSLDAWKDDVVFARDTFEDLRGTEHKIVHQPCRNKDRGDPIAAYAIAWLKGSSIPRMEVMYAWEIEAIRNATPAFQNKVGPWVHPVHYLQMWRKTVIRRLFRSMPMNVALTIASRLEDVLEVNDLPLESVAPEEVVSALDDMDDTTRPTATNRIMDAAIAVGGTASAPVEGAEVVSSSPPIPDNMMICPACDRYANGVFDENAPDCAECGNTGLVVRYAAKPEEPPAKAPKAKAWKCPLPRQRQIMKSLSDTIGPRPSEWKQLISSATDGSVDAFGPDLWENEGWVQGIERLIEEAKTAKEPTSE